MRSEERSTYIFLLISQVDYIGAARIDDPMNESQMQQILSTLHDSQTTSIHVNMHITMCKNAYLV